MPICEIIAVGTELLLGNIANTNARDISQGLSELGIHCYIHTTVGDNPARLREALQAARSRSDIIITTGGLGPTYDDITKQVVCEAFGVPMQLHQPTWERIQAFFTSVNRPLTPNNRQQAELPQDGIILENDWGTAPGCGFTTTDGTQVYMLPGPPSECVPMFRRVLMPILRQGVAGAMVSRRISIVGMGESAVEDKLRPLMERLTNPTLAPYAKEGEVLLRVTAMADTEAEAHALTEPVVNEVCGLLGEVVYGVDADSLEQVVLDLLRSKNLRLSAAESCTGGGVTARLTAIPGASNQIAGGIVAYTNDIKTSVLGVAPDIIQTHGAVSEETAKAMAEAVCRLCGTELGLGITGLAGPGTDGSPHPVGTVFIALHHALSGRTELTHRRFGDGRYRVCSAAILASLDLVRRFLIEL